MSVTTKQTSSAQCRNYDPPKPTKLQRFVMLAQCASKTANQFSLAGIMGLTNENKADGKVKKVGKYIGTAFLGNTLSGISDTATHVLTGHFGAAYGDFAMGGTAQGLQLGKVPAAKGLVGAGTDAAVDAITPAGELLSGVTGLGTPLAEAGMAGPVGIAKLAIDFAIYAGPWGVLLCTSIGEIMLEKLGDTLLFLVLPIIGMGTIGCILAILWYRNTNPDDFDRNTVFFIIKIFTGIAAVGICAGIVAKH